MLALFSIIFLALHGWSETSPVFRLSLFSEPTTISVFDQKTSSSAYLLSQLHSPLLWYHQQKLHPRLADCAYDNSTQLTCVFLPQAKFSNGEQILPLHFVQMVKDYLNPKYPGQRADLLMSIQNANKVLSGKISAKKLGLKIEGSKLIIKLSRPDSDFIYNLANPLLSPQYYSRAKFPANLTEFISTGPYLIAEWQSKDKITLKPNSFFPRRHHLTPPSVEFRFVAEDSVALNLYEKGELDFLRRLPTLYIPKFKTRPDFFFIPQFRFDYLGFGPNLVNHAKLRESIIQNLDYSELQKLFDAPPRPGCVGIPEELSTQKNCYSYRPQKKKKEAKTDPLVYYFSKQGGDDHQRAAEWLQAKLSKNMNLKIELKSLENKIFLQKLSQDPPDLFRKGLAPDRPTCLAVFENFQPKAKENYLQLDDSKMNHLLEQLRIENNELQKKQLCQKIITQIMKQNRLIPMGPISFALLARPEFQNWKLNELNQLDLSELTYKKIEAKKTEL